MYKLDTWPKILRDNFTLKNCLFGLTNILKNSAVLNGFILAMELCLMEEVFEVLIMALLEMLQFLVLITVHHLIVANATIFFLVLGERPT